MKPSTAAPITSRSGLTSPPHLPCSPRPRGPAAERGEGHWDTRTTSARLPGSKPLSYPSHRTALPPVLMAATHHVRYGTAPSVHIKFCTKTPPEKSAVQFSYFVSHPPRHPKPQCARRLRPPIAQPHARVHCYRVSRFILHPSSHVSQCLLYPALIPSHPCTHLPILESRGALASYSHRSR